MLMVLGAHRSGTSAVAGVIQRLGIDLGDHLLPAQAGVNERGFWEHSDVVALHDRLLQEMGSRWDGTHRFADAWWKSPPVQAISEELAAIVKREFGDSQLWGLKDPRLCRLSPLWLDILAQVDCEPSFIIIYRNPLEVAESLSHRDQMELPLALTIWLQHMLDAELYTRGYPRTIISYSALLEDWRQTMRLVGDDLSLRWPVSIEQAGADIDTFLDASLCHHHHSDTDLAGLPAWVEDAYTSLKNAVRSDDADLQSKFDIIRREYQAAESLFAPSLSAREQKLHQIESEFTNACDMIKDKEAAEAQLLQTLGEVEQGFKQAVEMLTERDAQLAEVQQGFKQAVETLAERDTQFAECNALLSGRVRPLAEALGEWPEQSPAAEQPEPAPPRNEQDDDKAYESAIDLRVSNNAHTQLYNFIQEDSNGRQSRVLEVGCSSGYFGEALKSAGHEVWGVEMSAKAADTAREKIDHVFVGTVEEFLANDAVKGITFDYITFGDVLEHLVDPVRVLKDCRRLLSPDGCIAASIPNVAHKAVRLMLLEGRWDYAEFGIMDNTHLRFFTRNSIVEMFTKGGFAVRLMDAVSLPTDATGIEVNPELLEAASDLVPDNDEEVFQFTVLARRSDPAAQLAEQNRPFCQGEGAKILCLLPFADWSVGNIRIRDPLSKYRQQYGGEVRIRSIHEHQSQDIAWADTVILQRDSNDYILVLADMLQKMGKRVIIDMDDLLTEVPAFLQCYEHCQQTRPYLLETLRMADAITVTTERLKEEMLAYNENVFVVPNCAATVHAATRHYASDAHKVNLLVASTDTVRVDFIASALRRLADDKDLDIEIICIGPPGEFLAETGLAIQAHGNMSHEHFKAFLATLDNTIGIIPLDDSRFSRCKSPVKFLDYSLAGIPTVCSDVPPYKDSVRDGENGILCANSEDDWYQAIRELALSASQRADIAAAARRLVQSDYHLKHAADMWDVVFSSTQAGRGQQGSELLTASTKLPLLLHHMTSPYAYRAAFRVLRQEGLGGVRTRLSRLIQ
jgi:2-polyprenyl-3-methyl-5-hydroxy-6-metoxy-1,4-benzoquinol methylase